MLAELQRPRPRRRRPRAARRASATSRLCVATRTVRPVGELIRFVAGPDGLVPDLKRRLPGRGVWVTARRTDVEAAVKRHAFQKSLRAEVRVPAALADVVDGLLERAALDALSIAHKASLVVTGFTKVEAAIAGGPVVALLQARDAGADGARKLSGGADATWRGGRPDRNCDLLHHRAIGFGIGPPKCGTCSAAGWAGRRNVSRALANSRTFSSG